MRRALLCTGFRSSLLLGAMASACLTGCGEAPSGGGDANPAPPPPGENDEGPIRLSYVCGNRFLITNAYSVPVSVTYRVVGSEEEGVADLDGRAHRRSRLQRAADRDPHARRRADLPQRQARSRPHSNDGIACTPATPAPGHSLRRLVHRRPVDRAVRLAGRRGARQPPSERQGDVVRPCSGRRSSGIPPPETSPRYRAPRSCSAPATRCCPTAACSWPVATSATTTAFPTSPTSQPREPVGPRARRWQRADGIPP